MKEFNNKSKEIDKKVKKSHKKGEESKGIQ